MDRKEAERRQLVTTLATARDEIRALKARLATVTGPTQPKNDPDLDRVETELRRLDPDGNRFAAILRRTFDVVYDGARTGRFHPSQLSRVEKARLLTVLETELIREFDLEDGEVLDFRIGGIDVDCRFSQTSAWLIAPETVSQVCLLISADDTRSSFSVGLLRVSPETLTAQGNKDGKRMVSAAGRSSIRYLVRDGTLPENVLLQTDGADVSAIFAAGWGQARVTELFRRVQNRKVDLATVRAVAMQEDARKRVRDANRILAAEGVLVLSHLNAWVSAELELPELGRDEFLSVRVARRRPHHGDAPSIELRGDHWVVATPDDPVEPAPSIPIRRRA